VSGLNVVGSDSVHLGQIICLGGGFLATHIRQIDYFLPGNDVICACMQPVNNKHHCHIPQTASCAV